MLLVGMENGDIVQTSLVTLKVKHGIIALYQHPEILLLYIHSKGMKLDI